MTFVPGMKKVPGSGRRKGQGNAGWRSARQILADLKCDPIAGLAAIAMEKTDTGAFVNEAPIRERAYAELAQYIHPKLRAIEHTGAGGGPMQLEVGYDDPKQALASRIAQLTARADPAPGDREPNPSAS